MNNSFFGVGAPKNGEVINSNTYIQICKNSKTVDVQKIKYGCTSSHKED